VKLLGLFLCLSKYSWYSRRQGVRRDKIEVTGADESQEIAPQTVPATTIIGEEHGHDLFRQVPQSENRTVEIADVRGQGSLFCSVEVLVRHKGDSFTMSLSPVPGE
jgi:hypothetical protein